MYVCVHVDVCCQLRHAWAGFVCPLWSAQELEIGDGICYVMRFPASISAITANVPGTCGRSTVVLSLLVVLRQILI